jgi:hypothetical protein
MSQFRHPRNSFIWLGVPVPQFDRCKAARFFAPAMEAIFGWAFGSRAT